MAQTCSQSQLFTEVALGDIVRNISDKDISQSDRGLFLLDKETFLTQFLETISQLAERKTKQKMWVYRWFAYSDYYNPTGLDLEKLHFIAFSKYEMMLAMLKKATNGRFIGMFLDMDFIEESCFTSMVDDTYEIDTTDMKAIVKRWFENFKSDNDTFWFEKFEAIYA